MLDFFVLVFQYETFISSTSYCQLAIVYSYWLLYNPKQSSPIAANGPRLTDGGECFAISVNRAQIYKWNPNRQTFFNLAIIG